jgi:phenylacetate-CoA ligase
MSDLKEIVQRFLHTLRRTPFMSAAQMQDYQRGLLQRLVRHAHETVPFYRDSGRLSPLFARDGTIDWTRWDEVPRLTRRDLQQNFEALASDSLPSEHGTVRPVSSSGTTEQPVTVLHTELDHRSLWTALTLRDFEMHGIDAGGHLAYLYPFTPEDFSEGRARTHTEWYEGFAELGFHGRRTDMSDMTPAAELAEKVAAARPDYLRVQPVALELMALHDRSEALAKAALKSIICVGEYFEEGAKSAIQRQLSCDIVQVYGSGECGRMATTCPECGLYHVNSEAILLEVVRDDGAPASVGEPGWVLATPLYNYAMPLIRYDHSDEATRAGDGRCSNRLPALEAIFGKRRTPFVFGDGTVIRPAMPAAALVEYLGAQSFQIAQTAPDRCEIRFVPGALDRSEMQFDKMTELLRSIWWHRLSIDYRIVDRVPARMTGAKTSLFVRETE